MSIRAEIKKNILEVLKLLGYEENIPIKIVRPQKSSFGDYSVSVAMELGKSNGDNPMKIAEKIKEKIKGKYFDKIEVVHPGFINFYISPKYFFKEIKEAFEKKDNFGQFSKKKKKVQVEFISANPTGPLTVGNGRGGPFGDVLANVFKKYGYEVKKAYYINDHGKQILSLGHSVLKDEEAKYTGEYIDKLNKKIKGKDPYKVGKEAAKIILNEIIKKTVKKLNINFDEWFSENTLYEKKEVDKVLEFLREAGLTYEQEGAEWFMSTALGDERDRVIVKSDGEKTYLLGDIAYHRNKFEKGKFDKVINIWGADHYGDVPGLIAGVEAMGHMNKLEIILLQFVTVTKEGKTLRMSKRLGTAIAMDDLLDEISADVIRFFFLQKSADTHLSFNLDLAKEQSEKNPVFYVQYAYARISSILKNANKMSRINKIKNVELLNNKKEIELMKQILRFPEIIEETANDYEVHRIPQYAIDLANAFHKFYTECHVLTVDKELREARLGLVSLSKTVLKNTLKLMGISAPEKM
jgi:arginyl-tRNA synthetase